MDGTVAICLTIEIAFSRLRAMKASVYFLFSCVSEIVLMIMRVSEWSMGVDQLLATIWRQLANVLIDAHGFKRSPTIKRRAVAQKKFFAPLNYRTRSSKS